MAAHFVEPTVIQPASPHPTAAGRAALAATMTRRASAQTYATIRLLADRDRTADAFRAYAYFRWVDDCLDDPTALPAGRVAFLARQRALLDSGYRGRLPVDLCAEEALLADLLAGDDEPESGLQSYLRHMMGVMAFDVARRGRLIAAAELDDYTQMLATAVADALFHFIGHDRQPSRAPARYRAVRGAHLIHMLRDTVEDAAAGYCNIPAEYLAAHGLRPPLTAADLETPAFRAWVEARVRLAREEFAAGRAILAGLGSRRCCLAGAAYIARFEWLAGAIERDGYRLRESYPERKSLPAGYWMARQTVGILSAQRQTR
ncbi:MAG: squalene/phytoene synthase family protein [Candidatus Promineofilum sp.]|nr:squalene/phytoene synthase family protein [Promineifilum sp.]